MPATSSNGPRCTKIKANGERCKRAPIHGSTVCNAAGHGGSLPVVKEAAQRRLAEAEAAKAFEKYAPNRKPMDNPVTALLTLASEIDGFREFLSVKVTELEQADWRRDHRAGEQLHSILSLYERSLDRTAKILVDLGKLNIADRVARLQEGQAAIIVALLQNVLGDLGLTPAQQALAATAVPARLLELEQPEDSQPFGRPEPSALPRAR